MDPRSVYLKYSIIHFLKDVTEINCCAIAIAYAITKCLLISRVGSDKLLY